MKLVLDEKLKHRITGIAVIISLGAIFAPALIKKSSQNLENTYSVRVKLPPKPIAANVAVSDEKDLFKTIKIAKVDIPAVSETNQLPRLAKAEILRSGDTAHRDAPVIARTETAPGLTAVNLAVNQGATDHAKKVVRVALASSQPVKAAPVVAAIQKPTALPKQVAAVKTAAVNAVAKADVYAVQLASFSQLANAQALVTKLHSKGYKATFTKVQGKNGSMYKVFAGHSTRKVEVLKLKTQLASAMRLDGFVVNTGVS